MDSGTGAARRDDRGGRLGAVRRVLTHPTALTGALTAVLAAVGTAVALHVPAAPLLPAPTGHAAAVAVVALAVAFFVTELGQALVEVRRQAYAFSLAGVPLLLGLLYLPPHHLLVACLLGSMAAFAWQRVPTVKFWFNTASYLLDTALVLWLAHALVGADPGLTLRTAALCYVALAVVDVVMTCLVLLVIRINAGPVSRAEAVEALAPAAANVVVNTVIGFAFAFLLSGGPLGGALLLVFVVMTGMAYRGFLMLRRRHRSLELVQSFIERSNDGGTVDELAGRLLGQIREVVRASRVELDLRGADGRDGLRVTAHEDGTVTVTTTARRATDRPMAGPDEHHEAALISAKSTDPQHRQWLAGRGARDALIVPLTRPGTHGTLLALDRLGDLTSFTADDLALMQALAGHLAVALHSTQLVQRLRHEASHDSLTGLPNRALLTDRMQHALTDPAGDSRAAVLLLDLDRFKEVNDALGHHVGDQLLQVVAERLREVTPDGATVARLGGDEFAVLLPTAPDAERTAVAVAEHIGRAMQAPVDLPHVTVSTGASIGVAVAADGHTHGDLLRHADTAMYAAKVSGSRVAVYTEELDSGRAERLALLADLHVALERDLIDLHYQPKLDLAFDAVTSVEALIRWTHPALGPLSPDVFIPLAESTGLIDQLTQLVLDKALHQCRVWQDAGLDLAVAVNLSARNILNGSLPDQVAAALVRAGLPAQKLILEITESSVMGDPERTVPTLERLAAIGVTLSLDDFGTGYSSLSYLQRLPVREVKIDQSFVQGLDREGHEHSSGILIRSIIGLGNSLGLRIVAEGVETAGVLEQLRALGCDLVQGFHVGRPVPADELMVSMRRAGLRTLKVLTAPTAAGTG